MVDAACRRHGLRLRWGGDALLTKNDDGVGRTPPQRVGVAPQQRLFA
jgi:hypothetical protein